MKRVLIIIIYFSVFGIKLFGLERTGILKLDLPSNFDIKSDNVYTKLLGIRKDGVFLVEVGTEENQYRIVFDISGNTSGFEKKNITNLWFNLTGQALQIWSTNFYTLTNGNTVSSFLKRSQVQAKIENRNKILEFKTFSTNGYISSIKTLNISKEEHYEIVGPDFILVTNRIYAASPVTHMFKYGKINEPTQLSTTGEPIREVLATDIFLGDIFSNEESIVDSNSKYALGYNYINNSLILSSDKNFLGYQKTYTNQISFFLIQDEIIKDIRYPTQSTANISSLNNQLNIIVNNPEQAILNIQSSTNLIDWNTFKTIQNEPSLEIVVPANKPKEFIRAIE